MQIYPHPLDYVTGIKYVVTDDFLPFEYSITPETFHVKELVNLDQMGFNTEKGEYAVLKMIKRDIEMFKAIEYISSRLNVPASNIYFYGLKDKDATTESYLFIKSSLIDKAHLPLTGKNLKVELVGYTSIKPRKTHFKGNYFRVTMCNTCGDSEFLLKKIVKTLVEKGLPSYYGYQRFGYRRYNSHILGKYILLGREDLFAEQFLKTIYPRESFDSTVNRLAGNYDRLFYEKTYANAKMGSGVRVALKKLHSILLDAYASYLFNLLLNQLIELKGFNAFNSKLPMPGCDSGWKVYEQVIRNEGLDPAALRYLPCFHRNGLFKPLNNVINKQGECLIYEFQLEPGMYASIVLREIFKDKLVFEEVIFTQKLF
ncbi:MAG: tRNA pseudouridine(13) synthase TruD [Desulfurococcaceae archaeon]